MGKISRRSFIAGSGIAVLTGSIVSDYVTGIPWSGYFRNLDPSLAYRNELTRQIDSYGDIGDRVAYAVNHLAQKRGYKAVPADTVGQVAEFLKGVDIDTRSVSGGEIRAPAAAVLADELLNPISAEYVMKYKRLAYVHAHANSLLAMEPMQYIVDNDSRLIDLANARYTKGRVSPDLDYGVSGDIRAANGDLIIVPHIDKPSFVRSGFMYWASELGNKLNSMDPQLLAATVDQTMAGDVIDQLGDIQNYNQTRNKELMWFSPYRWSTFPTWFVFTDSDSVLTNGATTGFGLKTMKSISQKLPEDMKYNWRNGQKILQYSGETGLGSKVNDWLVKNYGKSESLLGPEADYSFYKKLYASEGLPAYTFELFYPNAQMGGKTLPISNYFTVGGNEEYGISTPDFPFSPKSDYLINLPETTKILDESPVEPTRIDYLRVYLPHKWHTGNLFKTLWKRS